MRIRMIALDLDDTTLGKDGLLPERTKDILNKTLCKGVEVVIATGRTFEAVPDALKAIKGLKYIITSNGAKILDYETQQIIYTNLISKKGLDEVLNILKQVIYESRIGDEPLNKEITVEAFAEGIPYINSDVYERLKENGSNYRNAEYILRTRHKVEDTLKLIEENEGKIENISINFENQKEKYLVGGALKKIDEITVTSSFVPNWEIGGKTTSKATAVSWLCKKLGIDPKEELMACGDSPNDIAMIKLAKIGVAVDNASQEVKNEADYVTGPYYDCGVADAIEKFIF